MTMKPISELQFGFIDATYYLSRPDDESAQFFRGSFHASTHLEKTIDPNVFFLIGEKGTGKSAYAVYATKFLQDYNAASVSFETPDFARFIEVAEKLQLTPSQYGTLWSFVFLITYLSHSDLGRSENTYLQAAIETISTLTLGGEARNIERSLALADDIDNFFDAFVDSASITVPRHTVTGAKPSFKLNRIIDLIAEGLATVGGAKQFTLFLDGLDIRPDNVVYTAYLSVISSICNTIWTLNASYLSRSDARLKIVLLVRPDIFDAVPIHNRGPKLQNHSHLVEWPAFYTTYQTSDLFKMTDRILRSQQDPSERLYEGDAWNHYFNFGMLNRATGQKTDNPFVMFLRHSFFKPRDILQYLEIMVKQVRLHGTADESHFTQDSFSDRATRGEFSSYLMKEIRDQLSFYYTNNEYQQFLHFSQAFLGSILDRAKRTFTYDRFVEAHRNFIEFNDRNGTETLPSFRTADTLLQFLYELNIVAYHQKWTTRTGKEEIRTNYCFKMRSMANLRPKIPSGENYVMHYGVAKSLFVWFT